MGRFILRFRGSGPKPPEQVEALRSRSNVKFIDDSSARLLLVEAEAEDLAEALKAMPEWSVTEERHIGLVDPRPRPRESPPAADSSPSVRASRG